jgi:lysophospholipase L1-like esterase
MAMWRGSAVALALVAAALAGCDEDARAGRDVGAYVALGDSYTAGAGTGPPVAGAAAAACGQVPGNYPRVVAKEIAAELVDASCAGARTDDVTRPQERNGAAGWPPQLDAVGDETDLVTVSLGYNDEGFYVDALFGCASLASRDPTGSPCRDQREQDGVDPQALPDRIGAALTTVLEQVQDRAPDADLLVVGYPQLVPKEGTCPELPLATGDYPYVHDQLTRLDDAMRAAAEEGGATFVDVMGASAGHDICAGEDAWVNGAEPVPGVAVTFHPFAREQQAVADLVVDALARTRGGS